MASLAKDIAELRALKEAGDLTEEQFETAKASAIVKFNSPPQGRAARTHTHTHTQHTRRFPVRSM